VSAKSPTSRKEREKWGTRHGPKKGKLVHCVNRDQEVGLRTIFGAKTKIMVQGKIRMRRTLSGSHNLRFLFADLAVVGLCIVWAGAAHAQFAPAQIGLNRISSDPFYGPPGQHATEVEPHVLANGATLVAAFQTGRLPRPGSGAVAIGWSTSANGGRTWTHGFLPGLTKKYRFGPYDAATDPVVAYDAKHGVWMIATLPLLNASPTTPVAVSRSTNGGFVWGNPVSVGPVDPNTPDKSWIVCDNWSTSKFYGNCYVEWDDFASGEEILMSTSTDGGVSWGAATPTTNTAGGYGGCPVVQKNGTVVVPILADNAISVYTSTDGGQSWSAPAVVSPISWHTPAGGLRPSLFPSAAVDGAGSVYVVWADCSYRPGCIFDDSPLAANDLVYSTSTDGVNWSPVTRIPIDPTNSGVDHFIPGVAIDPRTSGATAHVAVTFYYYSNSNCTATTCRLFVGSIFSSNGGTTWNPPVSLAGPMQLGWLPDSDGGLMVGDYIATTFVIESHPSRAGHYAAFAVAIAKSRTKFQEAILTSRYISPDTVGPQLSSAGDRQMHHRSDKIKRVPERGVAPPSGRAAKSSAKPSR
jgi:hypothetical protein